MDPGIAAFASLPSCLGRYAHWFPEASGDGPGGDGRDHPDSEASAATAFSTVVPAKKSGFVSV